MTEKPKCPVCGREASLTGLVNMCPLAHSWGGTFA